MDAWYKSYAERFHVLPLYISQYNDFSTHTIFINVRMTSEPKNDPVIEKWDIENQISELKKKWDIENQISDIV